MDWMQPMRIFVSVVQNGSLSSAGRQLGLSPASVSRHIGALEESLGCRLVNRTSRKLTLTEAGELYYAKVGEILQQIAEANDSVAELQAQPRGTLRVHSRVLVGHLHVVPVLPEFLARYPEVTVDLLMSNRVIDVVEQNIDVDIRIGKLVDSSLVARKLAASERVVCASPALSRRAPADRGPVRSRLAQLPHVPDQRRPHRVAVPRRCGRAAGDSRGGQPDDGQRLCAPDRYPVGRRRRAHARLVGARRSRGGPAACACCRSTA